MILQNYDNTTLGIVKDAQILEEEDFKVITDLKDELRDVFLHSQVFRTRTEMVISVLDDVHFPTPDSKYWQSVREQNVMFQQLVILSYEYRKSVVEVKQLKRKLETETDDLEKELLQIEIEKTEFALKNQERTAKDRIREIKEWHEIKQALLPQLKYGVTDVNEHQLESYTERYRKEMEIAGDIGSVPEKINLHALHKSANREVTNKLNGNVVNRQLNKHK